MAWGFLLHVRQRLRPAQRENTLWWHEQKSCVKSVFGSAQVFHLLSWNPKWNYNKSQSPCTHKHTPSVQLIRLWNAVWWFHRAFPALSYMRLQGSWMLLKELFQLVFPWHLGLHTLNVCHWIICCRLRNIKSCGDVWNFCFLSQWNLIWDCSLSLLSSLAFSVLPFTPDLTVTLQRINN